MSKLTRLVQPCLHVVAEYPTLKVGLFAWIWIRFSLVWPCRQTFLCGNLLHFPPTENLSVGTKGMFKFTHPHLWQFPFHSLLFTLLSLMPCHVLQLRQKELLSYFVSCTTVTTLCSSLGGDGVERHCKSICVSINPYPGGWSRAASLRDTGLFDVKTLALLLASVI